MTTVIAPVPTRSLSPLLRAAAPTSRFTDALVEALAGSDDAQFAHEPRTSRPAAGADTASESPVTDTNPPIDVGAMTANVLAIEELAPRIDAPRAERAAEGNREPNPDASADPPSLRAEGRAAPRTPHSRRAPGSSVNAASPPPGTLAATAHAVSPAPGPNDAEANPPPASRAARGPIGGSPNPAVNPAVAAPGAAPRSDSSAQPAGRPSLTSGPLAGVSRGSGQPPATRFTAALGGPPRFATLEAGLDPLAGQVARGLAAALCQNGGSVTLRLEPDALGALRVRLRLDAGRVEATFEVANDSARRLLDGALASLRSALEAHGLAVDRLDVKLAERAEWGGQDADGPGVGPEPHAHGSADQSGGDRPAGSEHPEAGGPARAERSFAEHSIAPQFEAEPVVTPEGVGVGAGGALIRLRLDAVA